MFLKIEAWACLQAEGRDWVERGTSAHSCIHSFIPWCGRYARHCEKYWAYSSEQKQEKKKSPFPGVCILVGEDSNKEINEYIMCPVVENVTRTQIR